MHHCTETDLLWAAGWAGVDKQCSGTHRGQVSSTGRGPGQNRRQEARVQGGPLREQ